MSESWVPIAVGIGVMLVAAVFMAGHYRLEQRRRRLLRKWQEPFPQELWRSRESPRR